MKNKLLRYRVCDLHMDMIRHGQYGAARLVFKLLRNGYVYLRLFDDDWTAECALENVGCRIFYSRDGRKSTVLLEAE